MTLRLGVLSVMLVACVASAVECPAPEGAAAGSISTRSGEERLKDLSTRFRTEAEATTRWRLGWGGGLALLTVGQLGLRPVFAPEDQPDMVWGAVSSGLGAAVTVLNRVEAVDEAQHFAQLAHAVAPEAVCTLVALGETRLREGASRQAFSTMWFAHLANVLFNVGWGLVYWLGYGHVRTAILNTLVGTAIGEGIVLTQPTGLVSGWTQYTSGGAPPAVSVSLLPMGLGLGLALGF